MSARMRWFTRTLIAGLAVFAVYYPYMLLSSFAPFAFSGPEPWQHHWLVDDAVVVPFWGRAAHFALWMPTVIATQAMILAALRLVWLVERDVLFEHRTVRALKWVGACAATAAVSGLAAMALDGWWLTSWNVEKARLPVRVHLESGEMGVLLCGLGLFLLARVLDVAVLKRTENEAII